MTTILFSSSHFKLLPPPLQTSLIIALTNIPAPLVCKHAREIECV